MSTNQLASSRIRQTAPPHPLLDSLFRSWLETSHSFPSSSKLLSNKAAKYFNDFSDLKEVHARFCPQAPAAKAKVPAAKAKVRRCRSAAS